MMRPIEEAEWGVIEAADVLYDLWHQRTLNNEAVKRAIAKLDKAVQTLRKARAEARKDILES